MPGGLLDTSFHVGGMGMHACTVEGAITSTQHPSPTPSVPSRSLVQHSVSMQFCIPAATNPPKVTIRKVKSALKSRRLHVKSDFRFSGGEAGVPGDATVGAGRDRSIGKHGSHRRSTLSCTWRISATERRSQTASCRRLFSLTSGRRACR